MNRYDFDFGLAPVRSDAVRRSVLATPPRTRFEPKTPSRAHYERVPIRKTHPVTKKESVPPTVEYARGSSFGEGIGVQNLSREAEVLQFTGNAKVSPRGSAFARLLRFTLNFRALHE